MDIDVGSHFFGGRHRAIRYRCDNLYGLIVNWLWIIVNCSHLIVSLRLLLATFFKYDTFAAGHGWIFATLTRILAKSAAIIATLLHLIATFKRIIATLTAIIAIFTFIRQIFILLASLRPLLATSFKYRGGRQLNESATQC